MRSIYFRSVFSPIFSSLVFLSFLMLLCFLLLFSLPSSVAAQTSVAVVEDGFGSDARLQQTVAIHAEGIPVGELLKLLSEKTGVSLKADRYVADDKIIAFSPARPLRETLNAIAALYNDVWQVAPPAETLFNGRLEAKKSADSKSQNSKHQEEKTLDEKSPNEKNTKTRYILTRRLSARHYEDDLEQLITSKILAQLDAQVKALDDSPEELAKRPPNDVVRKNLEAPSTHGRQATRLYALLSQEQRAALFSSGFLNISFAAATPSQQQMMREAFTEVVATLTAIDAKQRIEFPNVHIVIDTPDLMERHGMRFRLTCTNNEGLSAQVVQVILGDNTYMTMGVFESDSQWLLPAHGNPYTRKAIARTADLPAADVVRKITKTAESAAWIDRLKALAEAAQRPVFADYYRTPALVHDLKPALVTDPDTSLAALDALCKPSGYLWWVQNQTLLLRKRDWYAQRRYEVPDWWLRDMQRRLRRQNRLPTYADVCQVIDLTPAQIAGLNGALSQPSITPDNQESTQKLVDLDTQEGLHELLAVVQGSFEPSASLPQSEVYDTAGNIGKPQNARTGPTPQQASLIGTFLNTLRQTSTPSALRSFTLQVFCDIPRVRKAATVAAPSEPAGDGQASIQTNSIQFDNVQVTLLWKVSDEKPRAVSAKSDGTASQLATQPAASQPVIRQQRWTLWLPLQLPDDRSKKTVIEVTPSVKP